MSYAVDQTTIEKITRMCPIIVGALIVGVLIFLGIAASIDLGIRRPVQPIAEAGQQAARDDQNAVAKPRPGADANPKPDARTLIDAFVSGPFLTYTAIAFAVVVPPLSFVVPGLIAAQSRRAIAAGKPPVPSLRGIAPEALATDSGKLAFVYPMQLITGAALNEGLAFFASAAYFIEKSPLALGLAVVSVVGIILRFPTRRRVELWIDEQREKLVQERQVAG